MGKECDWLRATHLPSIWATGLPEGKSAQVLRPDLLGLNPDAATYWCMILNKLLNHSCLWVPYLKNGDNCILYILYSCGEAKTIYLKSITQCLAHSNYSINVSQQNLLGL